MRWRFVDSITACRPWEYIAGLKAVSLEEYNLLKRFGRQGVFPESLIAAACVHLARWLIMESSGFAQAGLISALQHFSFEREAEMGEVLAMELSAADRQSGSLRMEAVVSGASGRIGGGGLTMLLTELSDLDDPSNVRTLWKELYAAPE